MGQQRRWVVEQRVICMTYARAGGSIWRSVCSRGVCWLPCQTAGPDTTEAVYYAPQVIIYEATTCVRPYTVHTIHQEHTDAIFRCCRGKVKVFKRRGREMTSKSIKRWLNRIADVSWDLLIVSFKTKKNCWSFSEVSGICCSMKIVRLVRFPAIFY